MYLKTIFAILLCIPLVFAGCSDSSMSTGDDDDDMMDQPKPRSFFVGVSGLIPRNYPNPSNSDWQNLFDTLPEYGEFLGMHVGWREGELDENDIPVIIETAYTITAGKNIEPYLGIGFEPDRLSQQEADSYFQTNGDSFLALCTEIAEKYQPGIFFIGVEINRYFEKSPDGFDDFIDLYPRIYSAVKNVSPSTQVGSNFQLDYMKGDAERTNTPHSPHWDTLDRFEPQMDIASFTAYPFFDYDHPNDIPENYFTEIQEHIDRPIMITETGWPSRMNPQVPDIDASEDIQVLYLEKLLELTNPLPLHSLIWAFQHDPELGIAAGLFDYIALKNNNGDPKKVFMEWESLIERPVE